MSTKLLLWPILAQLLLIFSVYVRLLVVKRRAYASGEVDRQRVSIHPSAWSDDVIVVNNNLTNQFQAPVLFFVTCFILMQFDTVGVATLAAAWGFVLSRVAHAYVHMGSNDVPHRRRLFTLGLVMVLLMMIRAAWALIEGS